MRIVRKCKCLISIWIGSVYFNIFLFVLTFIVMSGGMSLMAQREKFYSEKEAFYTYGFDQGVLYLNPIRSKPESFDRVMNILKENDMIDRIEYDSCPVFYPSCEEAGIDMAIFEYGDLLERSGVVELVEGRLPSDTENEVILTDNMMSLFKVGDVIEVTGVDEIAREESLVSDDPTLRNKLIKYRLTVVGFFHRDSLVLHERNLYHISYNSWLENRFLRPSEWIRQYAENLEDSDPYQLCIAIADHISFQGKNTKWSNPDSDNTILILIPKDGYSQQEIIDSLPREISRNCKTFQSCEEDYIQTHETEIRIFRKVEAGIILVGVILTLVVVTQGLWTKKNERLAYYFYGCSWRRAVILTNTMLLPGTLLGVVISWVYKDQIMSFFGMSSIYARPKYFLTVCAVYLFMLLLVTIPIILSGVRKDPIELLRGE